MDRTPVIPGWPEIEDTAAELSSRAVYEPNADVDALIEELTQRTAPMFDDP